MKKETINKYKQTFLTFNVFFQEFYHPKDPSKYATNT